VVAGAAGRNAAAGLATTTSHAIVAKRRAADGIAGDFHIAAGH
jgi:hypothetical protein